MPDTSRVLGASAVIQRLKRVRERAVGVVAEPEIQNLLIRRIRGRYEQGVAPDGTPWAGLMEDTLRRKRYYGYKEPTRLLRATDRLYNSIRIIKGSNTGLLGVATGAGFRIGVTDRLAVERGRIHNYGIGIVRRQFLGLSPLDVRSVSDMVRRRLKSIAKE